MKGSVVISLDFSKSKCDKFLVALTGTQEYSLHHFEWNKGKWVGSC